MQRKLTVVMPNYNHSAYLPQAINAILTQSRLPDEIIIIDDGSTDESVKVIRQFSEKHSRIRFVQNPANMGVNPCMNKGMEMATGDYIHYASADDMVLPGFYEKSMKMVEENPQAALCSSLSTLLTEDADYIGIFQSAVVTSKPEFISREKVLINLHRYGLWFMGNSVLYRKTALKSIGGFHVEIGSYSDNFSSQVISLKDGACFIPEPLVSWRRLSKGYSQSTSAQVDRMLDLMAKTEHVMTSMYADLFPKDYVKLWKRRWLLSLLTKMIDQEGGKAELLELKNKLPSLSLLDHLYFSLTPKKGAIGRALLSAYLFLQNTPYQKWDTIRRRCMKSAHA